MSQSRRGDESIKIVQYYGLLHGKVVIDGHVTSAIGTTLPSHFVLMFIDSSNGDEMVHLKHHSSSKSTIFHQLSVLIFPILCVWEWFHCLMCQRMLGPICTLLMKNVQSSHMVYIYSMQPPNHSSFSMCAISSPYVIWCQYMLNLVSKDTMVSAHANIVQLRGYEMWQGARQITMCPWHCLHWMLNNLKVKILLIFLFAPTLVLVLHKKAFIMCQLRVTPKTFRHIRGLIMTHLFTV